MDKMQVKGNNEEQGSFNDSELQDIMSEIESLESEYEEEIKPVQKAKAPVKQGAKNVDKSESKVKNLAEELGVKKNKAAKANLSAQVVDNDGAVQDEEFDREVDAILADKTDDMTMDDDQNTETNNVVAISSTVKKAGTMNTNSTKSSMEFCVSGDMVLDLTFNVGGQSVQIAIDQDNGFVIQMQGGMTFSIPLNNTVKNSVKKAVWSLT